MSRHSRWFMYGLAGLSLLGFSGARADAASERALVGAFIGHCINNAGRIDKIEAAARVLSLNELDKDQSLMMAPQDPSAYFKGWFVSQGDGSPYFLGVAEGVLDGRRYVICTIASPSHDVDRLLSELQSRIKIGRKLSTDESMGQRTRSWDLSSVVNGGLLSATDAKTSGIDGGNLSFFSPKLG